MKIHQLRVLVACAESGSLRSAAERLSVSHPAVTKTIRELEEEVKVPLIVRSSRGIELTRYGLALYGRSRQILEDLRRASDEIQQLQGGMTGKVSIGVSGSMALTVMPKALRLFRESMPGVEIEVAELPLNYLSAGLMDGSMDFLATHVLVEPTHDCEQIVLRKGRLVATVRKEHAAITGRSLSLRDLTDCEWLFPKLSVDRQEFNSLFAGYGMPAPQKIVSCQSSLLALALVMETDAIALLTLPNVMHPIIRNRVAILTLQEELPEVFASILTRRDVQLTPAAQHCRNIVKNVIEELQWDAAEI